MTHKKLARKTAEQIGGSPIGDVEHWETIIVSALNEAVKGKDEALKQIIEQGELLIENTNDRKRGQALILGCDEAIATAGVINRIAREALTEEKLPTADDVRGILKD